LTARLKPRKLDRETRCDPDDGQSPVPNPINSWYLLSEDSEDSKNDEDIEAGRPKGDGSNAVYLRAKALYSC
jgi:hypothetical protein